MFRKKYRIHDNAYGLLDCAMDGFRMTSEYFFIRLNTNTADRAPSRV